MKIVLTTVFVIIFASSCVRVPDLGPWEKMIIDSEATLKKHNVSPLEKGRALIRMARANSALGKVDEAVKLWFQIINDLEVDEISKARAEYRLGLFYDEIRMWEKSIEHYVKFSSLYDLLSESERDNFDYNTENGDRIMCHVARICELHLKDTIRAEKFYQDSIRKAKEKNGYFYIDSLVELLGDFYFRQKQYIKATTEYEMVSAAFQKREPELVTAITRPEYKIIRCLLLSGKHEEAKNHYDRFMEKWGDTDSYFDKDYVEKVRVLMKN